MFLDAGQVAENVARLSKGIVDALVLVCTATVIIRIGNGSLGEGAELDDVAIARHVILVGGVGTHII